MIKIYGRRNAYNVQKVLWTLGEMELGYEHIDVGGEPGQLETPEFLALNPHARIPVLVDGDSVIWESNTIVRYLCAHYADGTLWPTSPAPRSVAERWMDWELASLQPDFLELFWSYFRTPPAKHDHAAIQHALARCEQHFQTLNTHLAKNDYLAGNRFSMGDIPCGVSLYRYFEMGLPVSRLPNLIAWYERLLTRPAYQTHVAVTFEELRGRLAF